MAVVNWQLIGISSYTLNSVAVTDGSPYIYAVCSDNKIRAFDKETLVAQIEVTPSSTVNKICVVEGDSEVIASDDDYWLAFDATTLSETEKVWTRMNTQNDWIAAGWLHIREVATAHDADYALIEAVTGGSWGWWGSSRQIYANSTHVFTYESTYGQFVRWPRPTLGVLSQESLTVNTSNVAGYSALYYGPMIKIGGYVYGGYSQFYYGIGGLNYIGFNPTDVEDQDWLEFTSGTSGTFGNIVDDNGTISIIGSASGTQSIFRSWDSGTGALDTTTYPGTVTVPAFTSANGMGGAIYAEGGETYLVAGKYLFKYTGDIEDVSLPTPSATCTVP